MAKRIWEHRKDASLDEMIEEMRDNEKEQTANHKRLVEAGSMTKKEARTRYLRRRAVIGQLTWIQMVNEEMAKMPPRKID